MSGPLVEAWGVRWHPEGRGEGGLTEYAGRQEAQWEVDHCEGKYVSGTVVPLIAADRLESAEIREVVAAAVLDNFHAPDDSHPKWWISPGDTADAVLSALRTHLEQTGADR